MTVKHQVAVNLDGDAFDRLKRLASASGQPYAAVIAQALTALEQTTSRRLVDASPAYAQRDATERHALRLTVRSMRATGISYNGIAKILFKEHGIAGADGLPLAQSTIRSMVAL